MNENRFHYLLSTTGLGNMHLSMNDFKAAEPLARRYLVLRENGQDPVEMGALRELVVQQYMRFIHYAAESRKNLARTACVDFEDLVQDGVLGVLNALDDIEPERITDIPNYIAKCAKNEMWKDIDRMCECQPKQASKVAYIAERLRQKYSREPELEEVRNEVHLRKDELKMSFAATTKYIQESLASEVLSLDVPISGGDEDDVFMDTIESKEFPSPDHQVEQQSHSDAILKAINGSLSRREKDIIMLYYYDGMNQKEIAKIIGLSNRGVQEVVKRARRRLAPALLEMLDGESPPSYRQGEQRPSGLFPMSLENLNGRERYAVKRHYGQGASRAEIADDLGVPLSGVDMTLKRARRKMDKFRHRAPSKVSSDDKYLMKHGRGHRARACNHECV